MDKTPSSQTFGDAAQGFLQIVENLKATLVRAKASGAIWVDLPDKTLVTVEQWADPSSSQTGFVCQGPETARIFIVDSLGTFFQGEAGQLLVKILAAMKLSEKSVFICNAKDSRAIHTKIRKMSPGAIITLGQEAGRLLLNLQAPVESFRGKQAFYCGVKVMPTFHPSLLLEKPEFKRHVWEDMKQVMAWTGL